MNNTTPSRAHVLVLKQSLKLGSFHGHSANAVRWQVDTALLVHVLLRFMAHLSAWGHSFTRLFAVTRSASWERIDLLVWLKSYGTAWARNHRHISTDMQKPAIAIPLKPARDLADTKLRTHYVLAVGRQCIFSI